MISPQYVDGLELRIKELTSERDPLAGMACRWGGPHDNQFTGASVSVSILIADKEAA